MKRLLVPLLVGLALSPAHLEPEAEVRLLAVRRAATRPLGIIPDEVIVGFGVTQDMSRIERAMLRLGAHRARPGRFGGPWLVTLPTGMPVDYAVEQLQAMPEVEWAEPNGRVSAFLAPNDRFFGFQWHMQMIGAERTWDIQRGDPSVVVAVLDTGIAYENFGVFAKAPDWGDTMFVQGHNVFDGSTHANDDNFHGTHVASTISEATNNAIGVTGLAFQTALMPVKVLKRRRIRLVLRRGRGGRLRGQLPPGRREPGQGDQPQPGRRLREPRLGGGDRRGDGGRHPRRGGRGQRRP